MLKTVLEVSSILKQQRPDLDIIICQLFICFLPIGTFGRGNRAGMWGDIWETNNTYHLIVYYDSNGVVEHIMFMNQD